MFVFTDNKGATALATTPSPKPLTAPTAPSKHTAYTTLRCLQQNAVEAVLEPFRAMQPFLLETATQPTK